VCAAAVLAGGVLSATTAASAAQRTHVISSCTKAAFKPTHFIFFCADAGAGLNHAAYSDWSASQADGSGIYYFNDCKPNCAAGTMHKEPAIFRLYRPAETSSHGTLFTRIEVSTQKHDKVFDLPTKTLNDSSANRY
jgi:hypothetical protein